MTKRFFIGGALAVLLLSLPPTHAQAPPEPTVQIVKYAALGEAIRQHKGKVVLVDFWATT